MKSSFREYLKQLMQERRFSQTQLANVSGVPRETIRSWLKRDTAPRDWESVVRIATALGLDSTEVEQLLVVSHHPTIRALRKKAKAEIQNATQKEDKFREYDYQTFDTQLKEWLSNDLLAEITTKIDLKIPQTAHDDDEKAPQIWGDIPSPITTFCGREEELTQLNDFICNQKKQLVTVVGSGGMGKTTLISTFLHQSLHVEDGNQGTFPFQLVVWTSLVNAPRLETTLNNWLQELSDHDRLELPTTLDSQLALLLHYLDQRRILLVLDNLESILDSSNYAGVYRKGFEDHAQLTELIGTGHNQSALIITTRELPLEVERLTRDYQQLEIMRLNGLSASAARYLLTSSGVDAPATQLMAVAERYSSNPLGLKLIAQTILELYAGQADEFLLESTIVIDDIFRVLSQQFERLSPPEKEILIWLAIEREPVTMSHLQQQLVLPPRQRLLIQSIRSLQRRSLIETQTKDNGKRFLASRQPLSGSESRRNEVTFYLQNVVLEFVTEQWIDTVIQELETGKLHAFYRYPLLLAQASYHLQDAQRRLILQPIAEHVRNCVGTQRWQEWAIALLESIRAEKGTVRNYAAGNLLNLLLHVGTDLHGMDLSHLAVWQMAAQDHTLRNVNLTGSDLANSTFTEPFSIIRSLAYSPDGHLIVAGTSDGLIRFWQTVNMQPLATVEAHIGLVRTLAFSSNGQQLASGGEDGIGCLWDLTVVLESGAHSKRSIKLELLREFKHDGPVSRIAFSARDNIITTTSFDGMIRFWQLDQATSQQICGHEGRFVRGLAYHPNGYVLASGGDDGRIRFWDAKDGSLLKSIEGCGEHVRTISFSPNGKLMASSLDGKTIEVWRVLMNLPRSSDSMHIKVDTNAPNTPLVAQLEPSNNFFELYHLYSLEGHKQVIFNLSFGPNGDIIASCGEEQEIFIWNLSDGQLARRLQGHTGWVEALSFSPNGRRIATASADSTLRVWEQSTSRLHRQIYGYSVSIMSLAAAPSSRQWISGDHTVRFWNLEVGPLCTELGGHDSFIWQVAYDPNECYVASASEDATVSIWDAQRGTPVQRIYHGAAVYSVSFHPTEQIIVSSDYLYRVRLWSIQSGKELSSFVGPTHLVWQLAFDPRGETLVAGCEDQHIYLWATESGELLYLLVGHEGAVRSVAISPTKPIMASGSRDQRVGIWDLSTGKLIDMLNGHQGAVLSVAFSPSGKFLASTGIDGTICLWNTESLSSMHTVQAHTEQIRSINFLQDDNTLISGSEDGTIKLWDISQLIHGTTANVHCIDTLTMPGPYSGMKITDVTGITVAQQNALVALGAVE